MSTAVRGARRTFFSACEAMLRAIALRCSRGTDRLLDAADYCAERAR